MENFIKEDENGQAVSSEFTLLEKVKDKSEEQITETKRKTEEMKRLINEAKNENDKLKMDNLELRSKCSIMRTQRLHISKDIQEMKEVAQRVKETLESASKSAYMTSCEQAEYKNIIEKLEIRKIFTENALRQSLEAAENDMKCKTDKAMYENSRNLQKLKKVKEDYATICGKVEEIDGKMNELVKKKKINLEQCDNINKKIVEVRNKNKHLQKCYEEKTNKMQEIRKQIQEEDEQYQNELAQVKEKIEQLQTQKTLEEKEISDLDLKCVELNKQNHEKQIQLQQLNDEHTKLQARFVEISEVKQDVEENIKKNITNIKNDTSIYLQEMQEKKEELRLLRESNLKTEEERLRTRTELKEKIDETNNIMAELSILRKQNQQTEEQIKDMVTENELIALESSCKEKEIDCLRNRRTNIEEERCCLRKKLEEKKEFYTQMMSDFEIKIKEGFKTLDLKKTEEDQKISNYMEKFEKIEKEHTERLTEYEKLKEETSTKTQQLENELKLIEDEINTVRKEPAKLLKRKECSNDDDDFATIKDDKAKKKINPNKQTKGKEKGIKKRRNKE